MKLICFLLTFFSCFSLFAQEPLATKVDERLAMMDREFQTIFRQQVAFAHEVLLSELDTKYTGALSRAQEEAAKRGDLETALLFRNEKGNIDAGKGVPASDEGAVPATLKQLRETYRLEKAKLDQERTALAAPLLKEQDQKLSEYQTLLTRENRIDDALKVKEARATLATSLQRLLDGSSGSSPAGDGYLGHLAYETSALRKFPSSSNLVIDMSWMERGDAMIREAKRRGLKVVLAFPGKNLAEAESKGIPVAVANQDVVIGLMWRGPYFSGFTPEDLTTFGNKVHEASSRLQFWAAFVEKPRGKYQTLPVPPEVDVIVVVAYYASKADEVRSKSEDVMSGWMKKAEGRPVLLEWAASGKKPAGLVPETESGTMIAMQSARDQAGAMGLILGHIGENEAMEGLDTRRDLIEEIEEKVSRKPLAPSP